MCTFERYIQFDIETDIEIMISKGIWKKEVPQVYNALLIRLNRQDAVKIGDKWEPRGATINISQDRIGEIAGIDAQRRRSIVNDCIHKMVDAGILAKERGGPGSHGTMKYIFLSQVRANETALARCRSACPDVVGEYPDKPGKVLEEQVEPSESQFIKEESPEADQSDTNEGVRENQKGVRFENNSCTPQSVHNQEYYPETSRIPPSTPLAASTGIAPATPTEQEWEEVEPRNQPAYAASEPDPPPPATTCSQNGASSQNKVEKPKASQREKNTDFFLNQAFHLADYFAGDELEFTDAKLRQKEAHRFRDILAKLFSAPSASERFPDLDIRLQNCVTIVRIWIDLVKDRDNPAYSAGFISTTPGMKALAKARKQIFGATDEYREYIESSLDPNLQAMWRAKYGDNWHEKRQQELAARAA